MALREGQPALRLVGRDPTPAHPEDPGALERTLVARLRAGDPEAPTALHARFHGLVHRLLLRTLGGGPEHEDRVQEAFLEVLRSLGTLRDEGALRAWITTVTVRVARAELRRRRLRRLLFREPEAPPRELSTTDDPSARAALRATWEVLSRMPVEERLAFTLRHVHGEELTAGAQALGASLATFKRRLARAEARFVALAASAPELVPWLATASRWRPR